MRSSLLAIALVLSAPAYAQDAGDVPPKDAKADAKPDKDVVKASVEEDAQPVQRSSSWWPRAAAMAGGNSKYR